MISKSKFLIIVKREYLRIIKSKSFWLSTLMLPLLMIVIGGISYISQDQLETKLENAAKEAKLILIIDDLKIINTSLPYFAESSIQISDNIEQAVIQVKSGEASVVIHYTADMPTTQKIIVYSQDNGIFSQGQYDELAQGLLKQSILSEISDPNKVVMFNTNFAIDQHLYKDGIETKMSISNFILPFLSVIIYFLFTSFATNFLLMSVSEEKENRMIEIILASVTPKQLIWGKIIGQVAVILTQMALLIGFALLALQFAAPSLPINLGDIQINPYQIILAVVYMIAGFLILANTMVGAGAAMPNYKDAQSFSTIFIMLSVLPIYTVTFILTDPNSLIAYVMSYFPYSAPTILLLRNALGAVGPFEVIISIIVLGFYIYLTGVLAYKLFEYGALEYNQKISFSNFFKSFKMRSNK